MMDNTVILVKVTSRYVDNVHRFAPWTNATRSIYGIVSKSNLGLGI